MVDTPISTRRPRLPDYDTPENPINPLATPILNDFTWTLTHNHFSVSATNRRYTRAYVLPILWMS